MGLRGDAQIVGYAQERSERRFTGRPKLTPRAVGRHGGRRPAATPASTAGRSTGSCAAATSSSRRFFVPATIAEYMGWSVNLAERVDLGGATPGRHGVAGGGGHRARRLRGGGDGGGRLRRCRPHPKPRAFDDRILFGASSSAWGSPQAEFEIPYGNIAQNNGFAMYAKRYHEHYGWDERARAKIAADQRVSACANPDAVFFGRPITVDDVLASRMIATRCACSRS